MKTLRLYGAVFCFSFFLVVLKMKSKPSILRLTFNHTGLRVLNPKFMALRFRGIPFRLR